MADKKVNPGDIFIPHLDNGQEVPEREEVVMADRGNGRYYTRAIFRDAEGNPSFRPLAGGTASQINIGRIIGHMSEKELEILEATLNEERNRRKEAEL